MQRRHFLDDIVQPFHGRNRAINGDQFAVDAENDRGSNLDMDVRRGAPDGGFKDFMKKFHARKIIHFSTNTSRENRLKNSRHQHPSSREASNTKLQSARTTI